MHPTLSTVRTQQKLLQSQRRNIVMQVQTSQKIKKPATKNKIAYCHPKKSPGCRRSGLWKEKGRCYAF
jgi:hypothetical protein